MNEFKQGYQFVKQANVLSKHWKQILGSTAAVGLPIGAYFGAREAVGDIKPYLEKELPEKAIATLKQKLPELTPEIRKAFTNEITSAVQESLDPFMKSMVYTAGGLSGLYLLSRLLGR